MIDMEAEIFQAIKAAVAPVKCTPTYQDETAKFPLITVEEIENTVFERTQDSGSAENHARVLYEVNVYSILPGGKKKQAKELMQTVDAVMAGLGFYRQFCSPTPNLSDSDIYRITARYRAVIDKSKMIYWR